MTADARPAAAWRVTSASRRGSSHGADVPNQDAVRCVSVPDGAGGETFVVAVSDGHGGKRYVRSDVGSRYAVEVAVERVVAAVERAGVESPVELLRGEVAGIVEVWRDRVQAHAASEPFSEDETSRAGGGDLGAEPLLAYGATLLVAVVGEAGVGIAQIGDGDALIRTHGFATRPVPGDTRLVGGQTTSLCLETAADDFRFAGLPDTADPDLVLLASDGYGNSFADTDWWQGLVGDFAWFVETNGFAQLESQLPTWLEESAHVGGDDVTAVVVVREPLVVPAAAPAPASAVGSPAAEVTPVASAVEPPADRTLPLPEEPQEDLTETVQPPASRSRGALLAVLAALVVVAVVAALVLLLGGDDTPGTPGEPTTTPTSSLSETPSDTPTPRKPRRTPTPTDTSTTSPTTSPTGAPTRGGGGSGSP
ncbi:MAG TPA: protein phosphatase 2C domain-containing protein [Nocardioidaceae bacterium]|nr:protein phosphatase 2C domain-containing protein [Nocardioidaceae bacterium]